MNFDKLWNQPDLELPEAQPDLCEHAQKYSASIEPLVETAIQKKDVIVINQTILLVTRQYMSYRAFVSKNHRNRVSESGHTCIFHIFEASVRRLMLEELTLAPPMLFIPPPPLPPPTPPSPLQIAGIFFGEDDS